MAGEIYIADKTTLDLVKTNTDDLQTKLIASKAETVLIKADTTSAITKINVVQADIITAKNTTSNTDGTANNIKADTTTLKADTVTMKANLATLLANPTPTDWLKASLNKIVTSTVVGLGGIGTFATVLNITGKGYLKKAVCSSNATYPHYIKITVDGVAKVYVGGQFSGLVGVVCEDSAFLSSGQVATLFSGGFNTIPASMVSYPDTTVNALKSGIILPQPIYFNTSLLVQFSSSITDSVTNEVSYVVI